MFNYNEWLNRFPGTNFHELNIDWLVSAVKALAHEMQNFEMVNQIKYMGTWSVNKQQPPYSIVIDGNTGYLSLVPVPAGIDISNTEYWVVIANFTALIGDLGERVEDLEEDVNKLNMHDAPWNQRKIIYVGDSWGVGQTATPGVFVQGWPYYVTQRLNPAASYNMCVSNARFNTAQTESQRYGKQLETFKLNHTEAECLAITDIVIGGGINDTYAPSADIVNQTDDYGAYWMHNYINQYFPNAKVSMLFLNNVPDFGTQGWFNAFTVVMRKYKDICIKYDWHYIEGSEYIGKDYENLDTDGLHMTAAGYDTIGSRVAQALNAGSFIFPQQDGTKLYLEPYATADSTHVVITNTDGHIGLYEQQTNCGVMIFTNTAIRAYFTETAITIPAQLYLGKYYNQATRHYNNFLMQYDVRIPVQIKLISGETVVHSFNGFLNFKTDGNVSIGCQIGEDVTSPVTCDSVWIAMAPVTLPYSCS